MTRPQYGMYNSACKLLQGSFCAVLRSCTSMQRAFVHASTGLNCDFDPCLVTSRLSGDNAFCSLAGAMMTDVVVVVVVAAAAVAAATHRLAP